MPEENEPIYCDCGCGEIMAEINWSNGKIIIRRIRRGKPHIKALDIDKLKTQLDNKGVIVTY